MNEQLPAEHGGLSRAEFLRRAAHSGIGVIAGGGLLAACGGGGGGSKGAPTTADGVPSSGARGGRVTLGMAGKGSAETLDAATASSPIDAARLFNHYDPLVRLGTDYEPQAALAESWESNKDATEWTIRLRQGVEFHDGKTLGADDVIHSMRRWASVKGHPAGPSMRNVDLQHITKVDDLTIRVPMRSPQGVFLDTLASYNHVIYAAGTNDFEQAPGTGAFKIVSFTPGKESRSTRNANYWQNGRPYADELAIASIDDDSARLNALQSGTINVLYGVPFALAKTLQGAPTANLLRGQSASPDVFVMRVDKPPFDNADVRLAFKLLVDRQALVDNVYNGFGQINNDIMGKGLRFYAADIPQRERDVERAKSLLRKAGRQGVSVTLQTAPVLPGVVEAATLFAQQAKDAGIEASIKREQANAYFNPTLLYLKMTFCQSFWALTTIPAFCTQGLIGNGPFNETHQQDPLFDRMVEEAASLADENAAARAWRDVQQYQYDNSGYIVAGSRDDLAATTKSVSGLKAGGPYGLDNFSLVDASVTA
ncbi:MAG TPA: ABC transporter substrate-binding protein [Vicinamibacterales bacterium]|nr:ABC transporter substrate-binding protein [Vicinamibacterales bacterium]